MGKLIADAVIFCIGLLGFGCIVVGLGGFFGWPGAMIGIGALLIFVYHQIHEGMKA